MQAADNSVTFLNWRRVKIPDWEQLVAVLWPVLVYDVLVPTSSSSDLNILQEYVLRFASLGVRDDVVVAEHLSLDPQLVSVVRTELRHSGYLDLGGMPTDLAGAVEQARTDGPSELCSVLQDPFTGRVWPTVPTHLRPADMEWNDSRPLLPLQRGTKRLETVPLGGLRQKPARPTPSDVVQAFDATRSASARSERDRSWTDAWDADQLDFSLSRIDVLSEEPAVRWMPAVLYLPAPPNDIDGTCAFGVDGRPSLLLVDAVDKAARVDPTAQQIQLRLDKAARNKKLGPYREYVARIDADAQREIESRVNRRWRREEHLWRELVGVQTMILEAELDEDRKSRLMQEALTGAGRLFEGLFETINAYHSPPPAIADQLVENGRLIKKGGEKARSVVPVSAPIVRQASETWASGCLLDHLPLETRVAENRRPSGLFWHVERAVVSAHYNAEHPLRRVLQDQPDWLRRVHVVSGMRNKAGAHFGPIPIGPEDGLREAQNALDMVVDLLDRMNTEADRAHGQ